MRRSLLWEAVDAAAAAAKSLQLCPTLRNPIDGSPPGSPVPGILQARTLEWVAIFFSNAWKWKVKVNSLSSVQLFATPWTAAYQAPLFLGFSRQEYWSGVPLPSPSSWWDPSIPTIQRMDKVFGYLLRWQWYYTLYTLYTCIHYYTNSEHLIDIFKVPFI